MINGWIYVFVGLVAAAISYRLVSDEDYGFFTNAIVGVSGSVTAAFIGASFGASQSEFYRSLLISIVGATGALVLFQWLLLAKRRQLHEGE